MTTKPKKQKPTLRRDELQKLQAKNDNPIIRLKLEYEEIRKILKGYVEPLLQYDRIYPTHLPTQKNFRWSTLRPPLTNIPRECVNPQCKQEEHEWTEQCWSLRDIFLPDEDEILITWDHDNIEGRLGALILNDKEDLQAFYNDEDLHTITCCNMFNYTYPSNRRNPHTSSEDVEWRRKYNWQGKDTKQRVLAKNFNHGSRYAIMPTFVYTIKGVEKYGVSYADLLILAKRYIKVKTKAFEKKKQFITHIQKTRIARNLQGARRLFYDSSHDTGKEGFNHMISATVAHYNNETLILLEEKYGNNIRLLHNAHDGNKIALRKAYYREAYNNDKQALVQDLKSIIERVVKYQKREILLTAGIKVYD